MADRGIYDTSIVDELVAICGEDHVVTGKSALYNRARVPAPFPAHRWEEHIPQAVVLPTSAEQVSEVVKLANRLRIPVVPRAGGTGLTDGAVPLRHGIRRRQAMNKILEIGVDDRTVTVQPGSTC
jgi:glycolate oxidase